MRAKESLATKTKTIIFDFNTGLTLSLSRGNSSTILLLSSIRPLYVEAFCGKVVYRVAFEAGVSCMRPREEAEEEAADETGVTDIANITWCCYRSSACARWCRVEAECQYVQFFKIYRRQITCTKERVSYVVSCRRTATRTVLGDCHSFRNINQEYRFEQKCGQKMYSVSMLCVFVETSRVCTDILPSSSKNSRHIAVL